MVHKHPDIPEGFEPPLSDTDQAIVGGKRKTFPVPLEDEYLCAQALKTIQGACAHALIALSLTSLSKRERLGRVATEVTVAQRRIRQFASEAGIDWKEGRPPNSKRTANEAKTVSKRTRPDIPSVVQLKR